MDDGFDGSRRWELLLCLGASSSICGDTSRGFVTQGNDSGVCLLVRPVEDKKELPNLDIEALARNPKFGDGTLPYRSIDCPNIQQFWVKHKS